MNSKRIDEESRKVERYTEIQRGAEGAVLGAMLTPLKSIYKHCLDCSGEGRAEVTLCWAFDCPLWPYRLGCRPSSPQYHRRVVGAWEKGGQVVEEHQREGRNLQSFTKTTVKKGHFRRKLGPGIGRGGSVTKGA
ncbi:MAG: hypothetical protein WC455_28835 [Dehalococcoidia bacterium]|jgi:hypothetical protein